MRLAHIDIIEYFNSSLPSSMGSPMVKFYSDVLNYPRSADITGTGTRHGTFSNSVFIFD